MKQLLPFLLCCAMVTASLQAQQLKGIIVNEKEHPFREMVEMVDRRPFELLVAVSFA